VTAALGELELEELDAFQARLTVGGGRESPVELRLVLESGAVAAAVRVLPGAEGFRVERPDAGNLEVAATFPGPTPVAPVEDEGPVTLTLFRDRNSLEVFGEDGRSVISELVLPDGDVARLEVVAPGAEDLDITVWPLRSAY
jgi:sucrose-6-phosphate hydrolase SacC (GH32 family)